MLRAESVDHELMLISTAILFCSFNRFSTAVCAFANLAARFRRCSPGQVRELRSLRSWPIRHWFCRVFEAVFLVLYAVGQ